MLSDDQKDSKSVDCNFENDHQSDSVAVVAPMDLPPGYVFTAEYEPPSHQCDPCQQSIHVTVPKGGIRQGQNFLVDCVVQSLSHGSNNSARSVLEQPTSASQLQSSENSISPVGQWKFGLFHCHQLGWFHPDLWSAFFFPQKLTSKLLQQLQRKQQRSNPMPTTQQQQQPSWFHPDTVKATKRRALWLFLVLLLLECAITIYVVDFSQLMEHIHQHQVTIIAEQVGNGTTIDGTRRLQTNLWMNKAWLEAMVSTTSHVTTATARVVWWQEVLYFVCSIPFTVFTVYQLVQLRTSVRAAYQIPTGSWLGTAEDCCCVICCYSCTMAQMARQMDDDDEEEEDNVTYLNDMEKALVEPSIHPQQRPCRGRACTAKKNDNKLCICLATVDRPATEDDHDDDDNRTTTSVSYDDDEVDDIILYRDNRPVELRIAKHDNDDGDDWKIPPILIV